MATRTWGGTISTDPTVAGNWQENAVPGSSDDVLLDGTASGAINWNTSVTYQSLQSTSAYTQGITIGASANITTSGAQQWDRGGGSFTFSTGSVLCITGDANFTMSNQGTITGEQGTTIDLQGTGTYQATPGNWDPGTLKCAYNGKTTTMNIRNSSSQIGGLTTFSGGTFSTGNAAGSNTVTLNMDVQADWGWDAGCTLTGDNDFFITSNDNVTYNINAISGSAFTGIIKFTHQGTTQGYNFQGDLDLDNCDRFQLECLDASTTTFDFDDVDVTCGGRFIIECDETNNDCVVNFGDGTFQVDEDLSVFSDTTNEITYNWEGSTWNLYGNVDLLDDATDVTSTPGTSTFNFLGTANQTLWFYDAVETWPAIVINKSSGGLTMGAAAKVLSFTQTDGNFNQASYAMETTGNFSVASADTKTYNGTWTIGGNIDIDQTMTISRITGFDGTATILNTGTLTVSNYTNTDWDGSTWQSDSAGNPFDLTNPASMVVLNTSWKDTTASNEIDATDGTNTDNGGNTNIDFGAGGAISGDADIAVTSTGALTATGALAGSSDIAVTASGTLTAKGALAGGSDIVITAAGDVEGKTMIEGAAAIAVTSTGAIVATGSLAGASNIAITSTGTLIADGALAGSSNIEITATGDISGPGAISGDASIAITSAGDVAAKGALSGSSDIAITATGDLTAAGDGAIQGSADIAVSASGTLTAKGDLAGSSNIAITSSGNATGKGELAGTSDISITASATGIRKRLAEGAADIAITSTGAIAGTGNVVGVSTLVITSTGDLGGLGELTATSLVVITSNGTIRDASAITPTPEKRKFYVDFEDRTYYVNKEDRTFYVDC